MPLTARTFHQLDQLYSGDRRHQEEAHRVAQSITRHDLAAWLHERVTNPAAERYLLELFFGEGGVADDGPRAYRRFYRELTLRQRPRLWRNVIEGGEISQVMMLAGNLLSGWRRADTGAPMPVVYKKMPTFLSRRDAEAYVQRYLEYNTVLCDQVGIAVPQFDARIVEKPGQVFIYVIQEQVATASVCHNILQEIPPQPAERLYATILGEYEKLYRFNKAHADEGYQVGLDGQIPNWAIADYGGDPNALSSDDQLLYLDTNVPMIRIHGQDVVSTDMYFQALPGAARGLIKRLNLDQEVMDRYFQMRVIIVDFLSNVILHHRADLVPRLLELSNEALAGPFAAEGFAPITLKEVRGYYRSDVALWRLWRSLKLLGVISDGVSGGNWHVLRRLGEFYHIWTKPIQ